MKRSEILKLIQSVIDACRNDYDVETRSDNLLCQLEQAGMLPPSIRLDVPESDGNNFIHYKHEWEPENE